jgi:hypothetical protein
MGSERWKGLGKGGGARGGEGRRGREKGMKKRKGKGKREGGKGTAVNVAFSPSQK